ncbi:MAG: DUF4388 domain-containing protein [Planctomycetota bacterium]|jgi:hypothetical protein
MDDGQCIVVMMPKIARKTLGLADGPFSRVTIQNNGVVFAGVPAEGEGCVLHTAAMLGTFHADLLNNLFVYLSHTRQNGMLVVTTGPLTKVVFFKSGQIVFAGSTDATDRIGNVLVRCGYATQEQIDEVAAADDPRRFGVRVKAHGIINYDQLWDALHAQTTEICCSLVGFPVGNYFFMPNVVPDDSFSHFFIEPTQVLFRGMIALDEYRRVEASAETDNRSPLEVLTAMEEME